MLYLGTVPGPAMVSKSDKTVPGVGGVSSQTVIEKLQMIKCFFVDVAIRSQSGRKNFLIFYVSFCLFWKMGREGSLSFM